MDTKTVGSRRHRKQNRRRRGLLSKSTDVRVNQQCHTAKAVVATPGVRHVVSGDTKASHLTASAEGTKAFPVRKDRPANAGSTAASPRPPQHARGPSSSGPLSSVRCPQERVNPAHTSLTCFVCGELGERETQAVVPVPAVRHAHPSGCASRTEHERNRNPRAVPSPGRLRRQGQPSQDAGTRRRGLPGHRRRRRKRHKQIRPSSHLWSLRHISPQG